MKIVLTLTCLFTALSVHSKASVIMFEGFAGPGQTINVGPGTPYTEAGFELMPLNSSSAVFGPAAGPQFPGDATSWFGFAENNTITLTGPAPFNLNSALIGPSSIGTGNINFTITGHVLDGSTVSVTFTNLTTATTEVIGFTGLQSATFSTTSGAGLDDISVSTTVPEPGSFFFLVGALLLASGFRGYMAVVHKIFPV